MLKFIFLFTVLLLSISAYSINPGEGRGNDKGNGGDPYRIYAKPFPDQEKLNEALDLIQELAANDLDYNFPAYSLRKMNREYLFIEGKVIFLEGHDLLHSGLNKNGEFVGVTSFTWSFAFGNIYFTENALNLSAFELAKLIVHEILHQDLPAAFQKDEVFVEEFATSFMNRDYSAPVRKAFQRGVLVRKGFFNVRQFLEAFDVQSSQQKWWCEGFGNKDIWDSTMRGQMECKTIAKEAILARFFHKFPGHNMWSISVGEVFDYFSREVHRTLPKEYPSIEALRSEILPGVLKQIALDHGFEERWNFVMNDKKYDDLYEINLGQIFYFR